MAVKVVCFSCNTESEFPEKVGLRDECESCGEDLHVCKSCRFYDENTYNECKESSADVVREKERANYCDYYIPSGVFSAEDEGDQLKSAAEDLFKS